MRNVPIDIASKLAMTKQTRANLANPSASIWIGRPTTPLTDDVFLEKQTVLEGLTFTDASIAVCHPYYGMSNTNINIGYIDNGKARVLSAVYKSNISSHAWIDSGFYEDASDIAVVYDGTMPKNTSNKYEFITDLDPWVFWVDSGAVYGRKLYDDISIQLAEANCTKISAVRAMWSEIPEFDFGLVLFMILNGSIYYRQLIAGVWTDAELINFGPSVTWIDISAQRTWDYRIALQAIDSTGLIYEMFTQFGGMGSKSAEHIAVSGVSASSEIVEVFYTDTQAEEHLEISNIEMASPYGGLYSLSAPTILRAENVAITAINPETQEEYLDYGKRIRVTFDVHLTSSEVAAQSSAFVVEDSLDIRFLVGISSLDTDGLTVILDFGSFNNAVGAITVSYVPGTITSMVGTPLISQSISFTPVGLVPTIPPRVESIENI